MTVCGNRYVTLVDGLDGFEKGVLQTNKTKTCFFVHWKEHASAQMLGTQ